MEEVESVLERVVLGEEVALEVPEGVMVRELKNCVGVILVVGEIVRVAVLVALEVLVCE